MTKTIISYVAVAAMFTSLSSLATESRNAIPQGVLLEVVSNENNIATLNFTFLEIDKNDFNPTLLSITNELLESQVSYICTTREYREILNNGGTVIRHFFDKGNRYITTIKSSINSCSDDHIYRYALEPQSPECVDSRVDSTKILSVLLKEYDAEGMKCRTKINDPTNLGFSCGTSEERLIFTTTHFMCHMFSTSDPTVGPYAQFDDTWQHILNVVSSIP